jgi:hypothetical protein
MADEAPNAEIAATNQALDVSNAAALLTRAQSPDNTQERGADGKFVAKQQEGNPPAIEDPAKVVDLKTGKPPVEPAVDAAAAETAEGEDDYFEFPADKEGEAPRKVKLDDVLAAYEELPKLKTELETVRKSAPPPADYVTALQDVVQNRAKYLQGLEVVSQILQPRDPSIEMLNPQHQSYNPDQYYALKSKADQDRAAIANIEAQKKQHQEQQDRQQADLMKYHVAREIEATEKAWPEWKQDATRRNVADNLRSTYGFTDQEIGNIGDHRQLLVIRDALELRALKAKQAEAVKVVRQKPKLVKGAARTTTNPRAAQQSNAMQAHAQAGSVDSAVKALAGLI